MNRKMKITQIAKIAGIRRIQKISAEVEAVQSAGALEIAVESRDLAEHGLDEIANAWLSAHSGEKIDLQLTQLWSAAMLKQKDIAAEAQSDMETKKLDHENHIQQWRQALAHDDVATDTLNRHERHYRNRLDSQYAMDVADMNLLRARFS